MTFKNLALGYVATAPSPASSGTSLVLEAGHGARFVQPSTGGEFYATAFPIGVLPDPSNAEIVLVTARTDDTFTITRAQKDTTAKDIAVGWVIIQGIYAEDIFPVIDDDTMATASANTVASSESTKAYVDTSIAAIPKVSSLYQQMIINGNFDVAQRGISFVAGANNDDVYTLDRWNLISDGNDAVDVSQEAITDLPGSNYAIKLDTETAKRYGIVQFLEAKDAQKLKGKNVSVSFAVKSANISALRCAVLSWGSTADTITSDVVGTWADTPTWATNWTAENTPADLAVTSSWTTVTINNIAIDSSTVNNIALAIWTPNQETIGDIIYISQVQMNEGATALTFQPKSFDEELRACLRYYEVLTGNVGAATGATTGDIGIVFKVPKRTSFVTANLSVSNAAANAVELGVSTRTFTGGTVSQSSIYGGVVAVNGASGMTTGKVLVLVADLTTCNAEL